MVSATWKPEEYIEHTPSVTLIFKNSNLTGSLRTKSSRLLLNEPIIAWIICPPTQCNLYQEGLPEMVRWPTQKLIKNSDKLISSKHGARSSVSPEFSQQKTVPMHTASAPLCHLEFHSLAWCGSLCSASAPPKMNTDIINNFSTLLSCFWIRMGYPQEEASVVSDPERRQITLLSCRRKPWPYCRSPNKKWNWMQVATPERAHRDLRTWQKSKNSTVVPRSRTCHVAVKLLWDGKIHLDQPTGNLSLVPFSGELKPGKSHYFISKYFGMDDKWQH